MQMVYSRPLTYEYDEVGAEMLTPSHLIYGRRLSSLPEEVRNDEEESETGFLRRFRAMQKLYPLEVGSVAKESESGSGQRNTNPVGDLEREANKGREIPRRAAALDSP
ncbi:hypothetical protein ACROYT_G000531 [Oculina patagonica]